MTGRFHDRIDEDPILVLSAMPVTPRELYAWSAAALLVSLGLGIIYLFVMDRITVVAAFGLLLGGAALLPLLAALREVADEYGDERQRGDDDAPPGP